MEGIEEGRGEYMKKKGKGKKKKQGKANRFKYDQDCRANCPCAGNTGDGKTY